MKNKIKNLFKDKKNIIPIIIVVLTITLFSLFIISGDNIFWASNDEIWKIFFSLNGRYLGNLFAVILSQLDIIRILFASLTMIGIVYLIYKISDSKKQITILLITLLLISIPKSMFVETYSSSSDFALFVIPTLLILLIIFLFMENKDIFKNKTINNILFFLLGAGLTLFMENITIYSLVLGIFVAIYSFKKDKKIEFKYIAFLLGTIFGTIIMFSHPLYPNMESPWQGRWLTTDFNIMFLKYSEKIQNNMILNNVFINLTTAIILCKLYLDKQNQKSNFITKISLLFVIAYSIYSLLRLIPAVQMFSDSIQIYEGIAMLIYILAIIILIVQLNIKKEKKFKLLFILISIFILILPLLVDNPVTAKCFFITNTLLILFITILFKEVKTKEKTTYIITVLCLIFFIFYMFIYGHLKIEDNDRTKSVNNQLEKGRTRIHVYKFKYNDYIIGEDYYLIKKYTESYNYYKTFFQLHYGTEEDITILFVDKAK